MKKRKIISLCPLVLYCHSTNISVVFFSNRKCYFRKQKETQWVMSEEQLNENSVVVQGLDPGHVYEFRVVAVDGRFETPSAVQDIHTYAHLPSASDRGSSVLSSSGWFIGI
jgi:neuronal cell adhesion protein